MEALRTVRSRVFAVLRLLYGGQERLRTECGQGCAQLVPWSLFSWVTSLLLCSSPFSKPCPPRTFHHRDSNLTSLVNSNEEHLQDRGQQGLSASESA